MYDPRGGPELGGAGARAALSSVGVLYGVEEGVPRWFMRSTVGYDSILTSNLHNITYNDTIHSSQLTSEFIFQHSSARLIPNKS